MRRFIYISSIIIALVGSVANAAAQMAELHAPGASNGDFGIAGHIMEYGGLPDGSGHQIREHFCRDGRWTQFGGSAPLHGTYEISGASVCILGDNGYLLCRRIERDGNGFNAVLVSGESWPSTEEVRIYADDGSCF